jgi:hypothetical protein
MVLSAVEDGRASGLGGLKLKPNGHVPQTSEPVQLCSVIQYLDKGNSLEVSGEMTMLAEEFELGIFEIAGFDRKRGM